MMDRIAAEKRSAMFRYRVLQQITTVIRYLEILILTLVALWFSARIPSAAKASGDFLRHSIFPVLFGPRFLFFLGNAIVLTLLFKSRHIATTTTTAAPPNSNGDDDLIGHQISSFVPPPPQPRARAEEEVVFEDKNVCVETTTTIPSAAARSPPRVQRTCRRSKSEKIPVSAPAESRSRPTSAVARDLRRSETDVGKMEKGEEDAEEFRRVIEAFIDKQLKFQREESMAMVCSSTSSDGKMHHPHHHRALTCSAGTPVE